jgi:hypothetical protein
VRNMAVSLVRSHRAPNRTLEVRGSIPLGSTGKPKGLAAMRGPPAFRPGARSGCGTGRGTVGPRHLADLPAT